MRTTTKRSMSSSSLSQIHSPCVVHYGEIKKLSPPCAAHKGETKGGSHRIGVWSQRIHAPLFKRAPSKLQIRQLLLRRSNIQCHEILPIAHVQRVSNQRRRRPCDVA